MSIRNQQEMQKRINASLEEEPWYKHPDQEDIRRMAHNIHMDHVRELVQETGARQHPVPVNFIELMEQYEAEMYEQQEEKYKQQEEEAELYYQQKEIDDYI